MSALSAAAQDEDGDTISALRAENEQLRQALLTANDTLVKASQAGAHHARAAECLRKTVIRWAARAEQAEEMLEAIGAGGVGSKVARQDHHEQHLNMVPEGWKLVPVEPTIPMLHRADGLTCIDFAALGEEGAFDLDELKEIYRAMIAAAPQPPVVEQPQGEQEPVAWLFQHEETGLTELVDVQQVEWGFGKNNPRWQKIGPVYTHQHPPRQPLTDEQIDAVYGDTVGYSYIEFARAIERAHGIWGEA